MSVIPFPAERARRVKHDDKPLRPTWATGLGAGLIFIAFAGLFQIGEWLL